MKENGELVGKNCLLYDNLDFLSKKWMIFVLFEFCNKPKSKIRYSEIKKVLPGITPRVLSLRLNELVKIKILNKYSDSYKSPQVTEYELSSIGFELIPIVESLRDWGRRNYICDYKEDCFRCIFSNKK